MDTGARTWFETSLRRMALAPFLSATFQKVGCKWFGTGIRQSKRPAITTN